MTYKVYLSGPISGLTYDEGNDWRKEVEAYFLGNRNIKLLNPMRCHEFLRGKGIIEDKHEQNDARVGFLVSDEFIGTRDAWDTMRSDVVFVNLLGAPRVSIGTVLEIGMARARNIPVILVMEDTGNVHEHAMIRNYATMRFSDFEKALVALSAMLSA